MSKESDLWLATASSVLQEAISREGPEIASESGFSVPGDASFYLDVVAATDPGHDLTVYLVPKVPKDQVILAFAERTDAETFSEEALGTLRGLVDVSNDWPWERLIDALQGNLTGDHSIPAPKLGGSLAALFQLAETTAGPDANAVLTRVVQEGHVFEHLSSVPDDETRTRALCILATMRESPEGDTQALSAAAQEEHRKYRALLAEPASEPQLVDELARVAGQYWSGLDLTSTGRHFDSASSLLGKVVESGTGGAWPDGFISPSDIVANYPFLERDVQEETLLKLTRSAGPTAWQELFQQAAFSVELCGLYGLFLADKEFLPVAMPVVKQGLQELSVDEWAAYLEAEECPLGLVLRLADLSENVLSTPLSDALLREIGDRMVDSNWDDGHFNRVRLADALEPQAREAFYSQLLGRLLDLAARDLSGALGVYGESLNQSSAMDEEGVAKRVVQRLFGQILERHVSQELVWMASAILSHPSLLRRISSFESAEFRTRVESVPVDELDEGESSALARVREAGGFPSGEEASDSSSGDEAE